MFEAFLFQSSLAMRADKARFIAAKVLAKNGEEQSQKTWEEVKRNLQAAFRKLISFANYNSETMLIRAVDNFLCMLSETLQCCMRKRPELLRSKDQVRLDDVLRFRSQRDLVSYLVNRKLNDLSYGGLGGIEEFLKERFNLPLIADDRERAMVAIAVELRNIYTHNRGIVNEIFLARLSSHKHNFKFELGERFHATFDDIIELTNSLFEVAVRLDLKVADKFGLQLKRYSTWDAPRVTAEKKRVEESAILPGYEKDFSVD